MTEVTKFIESGILEMYVLGQTTPGENAEVERMAVLHEEIHREIDNIGIALEQYAEANAVMPDPMIQPMLAATIDYMDRMKCGEQPSFPPPIHENSRVTDYALWLNRRDLRPAEPVTDIYASIIGNTREVMTAIVWLKDGAPVETHTHELEKFLIVEGSCDITLDKEVRSMHVGDVLIIPLHVPHSVKVTSDCPCKIILQRAAA